MSYPPPPPQSDDLYLRFFLDPTNSYRKKQQLMGLIMSNDIAVSDAKGAWDRFLAMHERGLQEGLERGREEGLLTIARQILDDEQLESILRSEAREARIEQLEHAIRDRLKK